MSAPAVAGLVNFLGPALNMEVWDGETPRYDDKGKPINPESQTGTWPFLNVTMNKNGAKRKRLFGGQYLDDISMNVEIWGTERGQEERIVLAVDGQLQQVASWGKMTTILQGLDSSVIKVVHAKVGPWSSTQEKEERTGQSKLLYLGDITVEMRVHGKKAL